MKKILLLVLVPIISFAQKLEVVDTDGFILSSRSTAGFNYTDLSASNGNVGIRFLRAGGPEWLFNNNQFTNNFEITDPGYPARFVVQKGTGNIGVGGITTPLVRFDLLHGGGTGINNRSSSSFSTLDIDAYNGDAALRFYKQGNGLWSMRNRPTDNYFEVFELNSASRFVIQSTTGNVGIGKTDFPTYKLDILHSGGTGVRVRSVSNFSVVDIDADNGDAAIRLQKAGGTKWLIRNEPATNNFEITGFTPGLKTLTMEYETGNVSIPGSLTVGNGFSKMDHPLDPANKYLNQNFVESPDMMNIYNGNIITDAYGKATVKLPDYFEALNREFRYQLTVIGSFAQAIVSKEIEGNVFEIATDKPNIKVSWLVMGVRNDAFARSNQRATEELKPAKEQGKYLHPDAFGKPATMSIGYHESMKNTGANGVASSIDNIPVTSPIKPVPQTIIGTSVEQTKH